MDAAPISSPCVQTCIVDGRSGICIGCGRTLAEIASWTKMSEHERLAIMKHLPARLQADIK